MESIQSKGIITTKVNGFVFYICEISFTVFDDDSYRYVFKPYYDVIDILGNKFQGIPGLNIDLRKETYIRENITPCFISERVPNESRENYHEMLEEAHLKVMDPIKYLINTSYQYFGDNYKVVEYTEREVVNLEKELSTQNLVGTIRLILDNLAKGNSVIFDDLLVNSRNSKEIFECYYFLYKKSLQTFKKARQEATKKENRNMQHIGRKRKDIDELLFQEYLHKVSLGLITNTKAAEEMGLAIATYNRTKKRLEKK